MDSPGAENAVNIPVKSIEHEFDETVAYEEQLPQPLSCRRPQTICRQVSNVTEQFLDKGRNNIEIIYNEIYYSLENISKCVLGKAEMSQTVLQDLYDKCNRAIETLLTEEQYSSLIDSLHQLQYTLSVQKYLLKEITGHDLKLDESCSSSISSACSEAAVKNDSLGDASSTQHDVGPSRSEAISQTRQAPKCEGFDQVAGLEDAKQLLREALILPSKFPHLFQGLRRAWNSVLLYGPPGTGKTRLAHAVAAEIKADFYCISASDLLSSWVGESEKIIKELFGTKNKDESKKSIIFIDEIDSLCRKRCNSEAEHARRLKTELLIQMEEAASHGLFLLCATNCPWDIDPAFLRRFQRRIYVPTPNREARLAILQLHSGLTDNCAIDWTPILDATDGYSGSDLASLSQYALLQPIRELEFANYWAYKDDGMIAPCKPNHPNPMVCSLKDLPSQMVGVRDVNIDDFMVALASTSSTISLRDTEQYETFASQYGYG